MIEEQGGGRRSARASVALAGPHANFQVTKL